MEGRFVVLPGLRIKEGLAKAGPDDCLLFNPKTDFVFKVSPSVVRLIRVFSQPREVEEALAAFLAENQHQESEVRLILEGLITEEILVPAGLEP